MRFDNEHKYEMGLIGVGLLTILIVLIAPLLMVARYSVMSADDYAYATMSEPVWNASKTLFSALIAEARMAVEYWRLWQGTYFSEWLSFVLTSAFSREAYYVTTWLTVIPLSISMIYCGYVVFCKGIKASWSSAVICVVPWVIYQILLPPSAVEAFFWMCGAVLYTTAFAISLFHISVNISVLMKENKGNRVNALEVVLLLVLGFIQGGMNYIVGLPVLCIMFLCVIADFYNNNKSKVVRMILFIWNVAWMCVSIFSPGASNRQTSAGVHQSAIWAISHSFIEAFNYIRLWGGAVYVLALVVAMIPVYWAVVRKCEFKFRYPIIVTIMSYCIYATAFTPNLYALGIIGAYRTQNMYRFMLYILIPLNEIYWIGYVHRILGEKAEVISGVKLFNVRGIRVAYFTAAVLIIVPMLIHYGGNTITSVNAYHSLRNGTAELYYNEAMAREKILTDESVSDVILEPFTWPPYLLYFDDISSDSTDWKNQSMAQYFNKNSVRLRSSNE